ncbi:MAG: hypothetical protein Q9162_004954 [Coniocarpon cinnabarinum]
MRQTQRLLATIVKGRGTHLHTNTPTGLTGVFTHPSPRPHLIYLYNQTLSRLAALPEDSVYRQSTEALTRHRLAIVESATPAGLSEWQQRIQRLADQQEKTPERALAQMMLSGKGYLPQRRDERDNRYIEWGDDSGVERTEGPRMGDELNYDQGVELGSGLEAHEIVPQHVYVEDEPSLTTEQSVPLNLRGVAKAVLTSCRVSEIEHKIGSGLIEEVVNVAQGELNLVNEMRDARMCVRNSGQLDRF